MIASTIVALGFVLATAPPASTTHGAVAPLLFLPAEVDAKAIYLEHCATCHGENGDGKGTTELDRPARSFLLGGYSYGNTEKAVVRSVTHGIPGTPMPAFGETLSAEERSAVANFVIALSPAGTLVKPGASAMTVGDKPMVVHGMMPALGEGKRREPRSIVVGFPNGTTFQYRSADAQLVAVRQGDFLERRDWGGRGGAPLKPLGKITWTGTADADPSLEIADDKVEGARSLSRRIVGTAIRDEQVWIRFNVVRDGKEVIGGGHEILSFLKVDDVPVAVRSVLSVSANHALRFRAPEGAQPGEALVSDIPVEVATGETPAAPAVHPTWTIAEGLLAVDPGGRSDARIYLHANEWTESLRAAVLASLTGN